MARQPAQVPATERAGTRDDDAACPCSGGGVTTVINGSTNGRSMALVLLENGLSLDLDLNPFR